MILYLLGFSDAKFRQQIRNPSEYPAARANLIEFPCAEAASFEFFSFHWGLNFKKILQSYLQIYDEHKKQSGDWWNINSQAVLGIEKRVGYAEINAVRLVDSYNFT